MVHNRLFPQISNELRFVLSCTNKVSHIETEVDHKELLTLLDWDSVLNLALTHSFFPFVYNTVSRLDSSAVPKYVITTLKQHYLKNAIKVVGIADEIVRIVKYMDNYGIQPLILKGPSLSVRINEDITLRPSSDIDILVDPLEFDEAEKLLEQMEYKRISPDFPLTPRQRKYYYKNDHHFEYFHNRRAVLVELHWRIRSFNLKSFPTASNLSTQKINITEYPVPVMDDAYWLVYLMVHGYKHMWSRLRWLYDIKELMYHTLDWDKIIFIADNSELRSILHQTVILLDVLFKVPIPDQLQESVVIDQKAWQLSYTVMEKLCGNINKKDLPESKFSHKKNFHYYNFNSRWRNQLFYIASFLKPTKEEFNLIALPDILFPLYYLIKPFNWLWRHLPR